MRLHRGDRLTKLDHLTVIAPSLEEGAAHVREQLGIDMPQGGQHPQMGTHNLLLRLGDEAFLEVIAVDPSASRPMRPRWFGLDDAESVKTAWRNGCRLRGWVAQTDNFDGLLAEHGSLLGRKECISRGDRDWLFSVPADGSLPAEGIAPSIIDWGERKNPASNMLDLGYSLVSFEVEHPDPEHVMRLYKSLNLIDHPIITRGSYLRYCAVIKAPDGSRVLF